MDECGQPDIPRQLQGGDVVAVGQRIAEQDGAVVTAVVIHGGHALFVADLEFDGHIPEDIGRAPPLFHGRHIGNGLKRTARLAWGEGHVDLPCHLHIKIVHTADHPQNFACRWLENDGRAIVNIVLGRAQGHLVADGLLGRLLDAPIEAGCHLPSTAHERIRTKAAFDFVLHIQHKMGGEQNAAPFWRFGDERPKAQGDEFGHLGIYVADSPIGQHDVEDEFLSLFGSFKVDIRIPIDRGLGQPRQKSGLGQGQVGGWFAKIGLRRRFNAIGQIAVVNLIEVHL